MDELQEMLDSLEKPQEAEEVAEEVKEEVKEEPVVEEVKEEEAPKEEEQPKEEPTQEEEPKEDSSIEAENARLREQLNEMARKIGASRGETPSPVAQSVEHKREEVKEAVQQVIAELVTDEEADALIDEPKKILSKVVDRAMKVLEEKIMRSLPPIVGNVAQHHISIYRQVDEFYKKNSDLEQYRDFVGLVGTQIEAENPDWPVTKIYEETAKVARARLGMKLQAERSVEAKEVPAMKPALPSTRSSRKPAGGPALSEQQKEMVDMLNLQM